MRKIVLTFGLIAGGVLSAMMAISLPLLMNGTLDFENGEVVGYSKLHLSDARPTVAANDMTGVLRAWRGRGS